MAPLQKNRKALTFVESDVQRPRAVLYLRTATVPQGVKLDDSPALATQEQVCRQRAEELHAEVIGVYRDCGSCPAAGFAAMLKDLEGKGEVCVIIRSMDRLGRNRRDEANALYALRKAGAQLVSATEDADTAPAGLLIDHVIAAVAEFYADDQRRATIRGQRARAEAGYQPGIAPLGYTNVIRVAGGRRSRRVVVDRKRADYIRWAFQAIASGKWTVTALARELALRGLTTRPRSGRPARPVTTSGLSAMLRNPFYAGVVRVGGRSFPGAHEPLIDEALFDFVQDHLAERPKAAA